MDNRIENHREGMEEEYETSSTFPSLNEEDVRQFNRAMVISESVREPIAENLDSGDVQLSGKFSAGDTNPLFVCARCDVKIPLLNNDIKFSYQMHKQSKEHTDILPHSSDVKLPDEFSTDTNLTLVCEYCDTEIPLLNNDPEFSCQVHNQSKEHIVIVEGFALLLKDSSQLNRKRVSNRKIRAASSRCGFVEDDVPDWLIIRDRGQDYCSYCKCSVPRHRNRVRTHSRGYWHASVARLRELLGADSLLLESIVAARRREKPQQDLQN